MKITIINDIETLEKEIFLVEQKQLEVDSDREKLQARLEELDEGLIKDRIVSNVKDLFKIDLIIAE